MAEQRKKIGEQRFRYRLFAGDWSTEWRDGRTDEYGCFLFPANCDRVEIMPNPIYNRVQP